MISDCDLEAKVIRQFISNGKRERYFGFIRDSANRKKFIKELAHLKDLTFDEFEQLRKFDLALLGNVLAEFKDCYVISENKQIDFKRLATNNALKQVVGYGMGTILVFGDADRIYYEGEDMNDRWISIRK